MAFILKILALLLSLLLFSMIIIHQNKLFFEYLFNNPPCLTKHSMHQSDQSRWSVHSPKPFLWQVNRDNSLRSKKECVVNLKNLWYCRVYCLSQSNSYFIQKNIRHSIDYRILNVELRLSDANYVYITLPFNYFTIR